MPSIVPGYEYDVFISYRQNDNRSGWVTQFIEHLREELAATIKEPVNIYFDENPHDGLQDTHHVDKSLENKLRCLIFIPILSHTYCDTKSFAWNNEFLPFCRLAKVDAVGMDIRLPNGNVTSRVLPVQIHELDGRDQKLFEQQTGNPLRSIEFIFRSTGVNRPLLPDDSRSDNLSKAYYRDHINKAANAIESILDSVVNVQPKESSAEPAHSESRSTNAVHWFWRELRRRNVLRAAVTYLIVSLLLLQLLTLITPILKIEDRLILLVTRVLAIGFPFAMLLAWKFEISPHGVIRTTSDEAATNPYPASRKKPLTSGPMMFVLTASLMLVIFLTRIFIEIPQTSSGETITIAVLPFENRSGDPADKYIADGITDDIINRLTGTGKMIVRTKSSVQQFSGATVVYGELANLLQVSYIVKGSVLRAGEEFLVTAQLMDARESYIWGDTFKHNANNIIQAQSEISTKIVFRLRIKLNELELIRLNELPTENPTAYDYYLRGRTCYFKYQIDANDSAISYFKKAIALDPAFARAWAGLGDSFAQMHGRFGREYYWTDSGLVSSQRAIDLDSNLAEGYKAKAVAYSYQKRYDMAVPLLLKAVEISPTYVQAVGNLGTNYYSLRDLPNALKWQLRSVGLDPANWIPYHLIGRTYRLLGDLQQSESWLIKSLEKPKGKRWDTYEHLAYTYFAQGRKEKALQLLEELLPLGQKDTRVLETAGLIAHFAGDEKAAESYFLASIENNPSYKEDRNTFSPIGLGQIRLEQGNKVESEVYLSRALFNLNSDLEQGSQSAELPYYIASIHAIRNNREKALEWLRQAIEKQWVDYAMIEHGPYFRKYRTDPAVIEIVQALKSRTEQMRKGAKIE